MAKSLQDQLLRAGLANQKQAVRARKAKNQKEKLQRTGKPVEDEAAELVRASEAAKRERDRALNQQRNAAAEQRAIQAQIRELVTLNRITERGDTEFRFTEGKTVRTLLLTEPQRQALVRGTLAIVRIDERYDLVPRKAAEKISERDDSVVVLCNDPQAADTGTATDEDDDYADYKVPDDLMW